MYFRQNGVPVPSSVEGFSFLQKSDKKVWMYVLLVIVVLIAIFLIMRSRKSKPRFGLKFL